jgi:hypothetical protein
VTAIAPRTTATGRLANGELRRQVAAWLDARPGAHTPGTIARALERSAGAVGNALTTLASRGQAELVPGKPSRYQATAGTSAAAAAREALAALEQAGTATRTRRRQARRTRHLDRCSRSRSHHRPGRRVS